MEHQPQLSEILKLKDLHKVNMADNKNAQEYALRRAEEKRQMESIPFLIDLIALEARGEGIDGMSVVARSILNRQKFLKEKKDYQGDPVYKNAYLTKGKTDLMSLLTAKNQYEPVNSKGQLDYDAQDPITEKDRDYARHALTIASTPKLYAALVEAENLPEEAFYVTGFRTKKAKEDASQKVGNFTYKNHIFNTATGTKKPYKK